MNRLKTLKPFAKFLTYILERNPFEFGLIPDQDGYVKIRELLKAIVEEDGWSHIKKSHLDELAYTFPDFPFEISENRIRPKDRSKYQKPVYAEKMPKEIYTAIRNKAHFHVTKKGIDSGESEYVLFSSDVSIAEKIGRRKDRKPVILKINTALAEDEGVFFYTAGDSIFLAKYIPTGCFTGPPLPEQKETKTKKQTGKPVDKKSSSTPGSYFPEMDNIYSTTTQKSKKRDKSSWKANKKRIRREKERFDG